MVVSFNNQNTKNSVFIDHTFNDTISHMSFGPNRDSSVFLVSSSWDGFLSCWEISGNRSITFRGQQEKSPQPILHTSWNSDGNQVFAAYCDGTAKVWDLQSNQLMTVAKHDKPVRTVHFVGTPNYKCIITGSWDKTVKFWDGRSPTPMRVLTLESNLVTSDMIYPQAAFLCVNNKVQLCALEKEPRFHKMETISDIKFTGRSLAMFTNQSKSPEGFAVGGSDGRLHVVYFNNSGDNYTFKCHRQTSDQITKPVTQTAFMVNGVAFHPVHRTLLTAGGDGYYYGWNIRSRAKIKMSDKFGGPLTGCAFSGDGNVMAVSVGYDWARGYRANGSNRVQIQVKATGNDMNPSNSFNWR